MGTDQQAPLTIDQLAARTGTTTRRIRSLQTRGLLPPPELRGRTGIYGHEHCARLTAILGLQERGFSLESIAVLFDALRAGQSLAAVLGSAASVPGAGPDPGLHGPDDTAELYGFAELQPAAPARRDGKRSLLSVVPTTVWDESRAS